jgi:hypothetical protein
MADCSDFHERVDKKRRVSGQGATLSLKAGEEKELVLTVPFSVPPGERGWAEWR